MSPVSAQALLPRLLLCWCVGTAAAADAQQPLDLRTDSELVQALDSIFAAVPAWMEPSGLPGLSLAVVDHDGIVRVEGFGVLYEGGDTPVKPSTLFSLQSVSKSLTATGILCAVEDGLVDLDEPITEYLPDFTVHSRWQEHPGRLMTLRMLLSHHAGFTHEAPVGNNYYVEFPSFEAHIASIRDTWLRGPVGERFLYSNLGVDLCGSILQAVSAQPFARYMKDRVLDPIGMTRATFDWDVIREEQDRATGHDPRVESVPLEFALIPSGGLYASAEDMAAFVRFQLNEGDVDGELVLGPEWLEEMTTIPFPTPHQVNGYCLGIVRQSPRGFLHLNHAGGGFGFQTYVGWYPELGYGIVVLQNAEQGLAYEIPDRILNTLLAARPGLAAAPATMAIDDRPAIDLDPPSLKRLLGSYLSGGNWIELSLLDGRPVLQIQGSPPILFSFVSETEGFAARGNELRHFRFVLDENGRPRHAQQLDDGQSADYNDGPADPPGPDKPQWQALEGRYQHTQYGEASRTMIVQRRDGYLYLDQLRLQEHEPGLFFSSTGEALDLRGEVAMWRNIRLERVAGE